MEPLMLIAVIIILLGLIGPSFVSPFLFLQAIVLFSSNRNALAEALLSIFVSISVIAFYAAANVFVPQNAEFGWSFGLLFLSSPFMILGSIFGITAMRFKRRLLVLVLFVILLPATYFVVSLPFSSATSYFKITLLLLAVVILSFVITVILSLVFKIPEQIKSSDTKTESQIIKLAVAWMVMIGINCLLLGYMSLSEH